MTPSKRERAQKLLAENRFRDAIAVCAAGLADNPADEALRVALARAHMALHQWKEAQSELLYVVKANRASRDGFALLGETLLRRSDYERAVPVLQHAQNLDPTDPSILSMLRRARARKPLDPAPTPAAPLERETSDVLAEDSTETRTWPKKFEAPVPLSEFAKRSKSVATTHGRRDQLTAGERTRILRMLRDEGGRLADESSVEVSDIDWDLDDEPVPQTILDPGLERATRRAHDEEVAELLPDDAFIEELGEYRLHELLGEGGFGRVFRAVKVSSQGLQRQVVLKRMQRHLAEHAEYIERFKNEARLVENLRHPNIAAVENLDRIDGEWVISFEYVAGYDVWTLFEYARATNLVIPVRIVVHLIAQVCAALEHAYTATLTGGREARVVHRDVSPSNVLVSYDGAVKLTDFGLAYSRAHGDEMGILVGKVGYMSPELLRDEVLDNRHDVFSTGLMLYELLEGRRAHEGDPASILVRIRDGFTLPFERDIPPELKTIIANATAHDRDKRFASAAELESELNAIEDRNGWRRSERELKKFLRDHRQGLDAVVSAVRTRKTHPDASRMLSIALPRVLAASAPLPGVRAEGSISREVRERFGTGASISNHRAREFVMQGLRAGVEAKRASTDHRMSSRQRDAAADLIKGVETSLFARLRAAFPSEQRAIWVDRRQKLGIATTSSRERAMQAFLEEERLPSLALLGAWLSPKRCPEPTELWVYLQTALGLEPSQRETLCTIGEVRNVLAHLVEYEQKSQPLGPAAKYLTVRTVDGRTEIHLTEESLREIEVACRTLIRRPARTES